MQDPTCKFKHQALIRGWKTLNKCIDLFHKNVLRTYYVSEATFGTGGKIVTTTPRSVSGEHRGKMEINSKIVQEYKSEL